MPNSLELTFVNNPNGIYFPNQVVAGTVELRLSEVVKARALRLIVSGKAECKWSETSESGNRRRTKHYQGIERYLNSVTYMFGSEIAEPIEVPAGVHIYNFECVLPELLPYSVEIDKGFVRYKAEATLDIPNGWDHVSEKSFTVVRHENPDLVRSPNYRQPCEVEEIKNFCCLSFTSDPLIMTLRMPKTGFAQGESIPIYVQMVNKSSIDIFSTTLTLERIETFNSTSPPKTKTDVSVVRTHNSRGVRAGRTVYFDEFFTIPSNLPLSTDPCCKVFEIKYVISFQANADSFGFAPTMKIDIAIGDFGTEEEFPGPSEPVASSTQVLLDSTDVPQPRDDLPPSFEEATKVQARTLN